MRLYRSLPPCGEGTGRGVAACACACGLPPSPSRGEGALALCAGVTADSLLAVFCKPRAAHQGPVAIEQHDLDLDRLAGHHLRRHRAGGLRHRVAERDTVMARVIEGL